MRTPGRGERRLLSVVTPDRLRRVLRVHARRAGVPLAATASARCRATTRHTRTCCGVDGHEHRVDYEPGESTTGLFGGNSNWRGPIWFPVNYLLIESLQKFHHYFGDDFTVECPTGSGTMMTLARGRRRRSRGGCRASSCATRTAGGRSSAATTRCSSTIRTGATYVPFHEYFHGDTGRGVGASHQTGWTALVAKLLQQSGD